MFVCNISVHSRRWSWYEWSRNACVTAKIPSATSS